VPTIVYLDVEDEITSAAARIRATADRRVAIVVPFGSRVATSRINFRLLAREAMVNGKRLDIVAPDASARALAASAGIPVFGSVGEYEAALDAPEPRDGDATDGGPGTAAAGAGAAAAAAAGAAGAAGAAAAAGAAGAALVGAAGAGPAARSDPRTGAAQAAPPIRQARPRTPEDDEELDAVVQRSREIPVVKARRRRPGAGLVAGILLLLVAITAAAVAGFLFLPAADITVTPQVEPVGPIRLTVKADPSATAVDPANAVIPAQTVTIPVEVSGDFPATGVRVVTTPAKGAVRWKNCDPSSSYRIPKGTTVSTSTGIDFAIDEETFLPVAVISGSGTSLTLQCQVSEVTVTAVQPGPAGNVPQGTIRVIPARYNRNLLSVNNPAPTTGGTKQQFPRVSKKDVDGAMAQLDQLLQDQFQQELADPANVPDGATVFPDTAVLGEAQPSVDPATLIGTEGESFTLGLSAEGTVTAVDQTPVKAIAEAALQDAVDPGHELVEGSTQVKVGEGKVVDGVVEFPVEGSAKQVQPVDAATLLPMVLGLSEADAQAALEPYGEVSIVLWPGFVTTIPTWDRRVTLVVAEPYDPNPAPSAPAATATPHASAPPSTHPAPSGSPSQDGGPSGSPVPSG
jgi:hypothetical protein